MQSFEEENRPFKEEIGPECLVVEITTVPKIYLLACCCFMNDAELNGD